MLTSKLVKLVKFVKFVAKKKCAQHPTHKNNNLRLNLPFSNTHFYFKNNFLKKFYSETLYFDTFLFYLWIENFVTKKCI